MKQILAYALAFFSLTVFAAPPIVSDAQVSSSQGYFRNFVPNFAGLKSTNGWTSSNLTLTRDTAAGYLFEGVASLKLASATHTASVRTGDITLVEPYLSGPNCEASVWYKDDGTKWQLEIRDTGGSNVLASVALTNATNWTKATINYPCTNSARLYVISTASSPANLHVAGFYWGRATNIGSVAQAQHVGAISFTGATACQWQTASTSFANYSADSDCNTPTATGVFGTAAGKIPGGTATNLSPGKYMAVVTYTAMKTGTVDDLIWNRLTDGTTNSEGQSWYVGTNANFMAPSSLSFMFEYSTAQASVTFQMQGKTNSASNNAAISAASANAGFRIDLYRFPTSSELAFRPDQTPASWSGYHDNTCSFGRTNTGYGNATADATCGFTEVANRNFGTVTSYLSGSDKLPGIVFTPPRVGRYFICAQPTVGSGTSFAQLSVRLDDTSTVITESVHRPYTDGASGAYTTIPLCGIYNVASIASTTIRLATAASSGTVTIAATGIIRGAVEWSIVELDAPFPASILKGGYLGTQTNDNPTAGFVGETVEQFQSVKQVAAASGSYKQVDSVSVGPGDWEVSIVWYLDGAGLGGTIFAPRCAFSTTTASNAGTTYTKDELMSTYDAGASVANGIVGPFRLSLASTTTYYVNCRINYSSGTNTQGWQSRVFMRRIR